MADCKDCIHSAMCFLTHMDDSPACCEFVDESEYVKVIRCQDCKNGKTWKNAFGIEGFKCELFCADISPEAFCSYGERRSGDEWRSVRKM